jgi:transcriptional activator for dhaKLM operon
MHVQPSPDLDQLKQYWSQYTGTGRLPTGLNPLVAAAWQRCAPRINPRTPPQWSGLNEDVLALTLKQRQTLCALARPILEDVYQYLEGVGVMLAFVDNTGCLLEMSGDPEMLAHMAALGVRRGVFLHENRIGAIAFSSALLEGAPIQMTGAEHFLEYFHGLSSAAAPIFATTGQVVGAAGLLTTVDCANRYAAGLALAAARAIENQLHAESLTTEANTRATELNTTLDASSEAVLVWDAQGIVMHVNQQAGVLLGLNAASVMGRSIFEYIAFPETLADAVRRGKELTDAEVTLNVHGQTRTCLTSLRLVRAHPSEEPVNYIVTLRQIEHVHQLVNRLVGAHASLTLNDLISHSTAAKRVRRQALAAADAKACLLIQGEAGTGKNVLARAIHNSSRRAVGPFLSVNCRAVPHELVLGEFLGYEAGSFKMPAGQPSKFELAHGGTLFLDEVDAMPFDMQAALLRVIEMHDVIRLGGKRVIPVDVRIIASSHTLLEARAGEGSFRSDLLLRLSSFVINMPPLRECGEDIPHLINRVVDRLRNQLGHRVRLTSEAEAALLAYPWPGNIRELESVLERAALACDGEPIGLNNLPPSLRERRVVRNGKLSPEPVRSLSEAERQAILSAFRATQGNVTQTANVLGIGRTTLWRKMKEFHISPDLENLT